MYPLADVVRHSTALRDRVLAAPDLAGRLTAAESWLRERLTPGSADPVVRHLAHRLHEPGVRIGALSAETGYSERHLSALFRRRVGVTPKQYARIQRFRAVLRALGRQEAPMHAAPPELNWAQLAPALGYADQSHLSHEFQAFAGMSPGAYLVAYRGLENYLPITLTEHPAPLPQRP